jgi:hypothetical protein
VSNWSANFVHALCERGLDSESAHRLTCEALEQAADHGLTPEGMFGPATAYADQLARAMRSTTAAPLPAPSGERVALRLTGVSKRYGRRQVLRNVSLEVGRGEVASPRVVQLGFLIGDRFVSVLDVEGPSRESL